MNKPLVAIGLLFGIGGLLFSILPADVHMTLFSGHSQNMPTGNMMAENSMHQDEAMPQHHNHGASVTWGILVAIIGFGISFAGWKLID